MELKCSYCKAPFSSHDEVVRHCIAVHEDEKVSYITTYVTDQNVKYKRRTFNLVGRDISCGINNVCYNSASGKIEIPSKSPTKSPMHKMSRVNTPSKTVHKQLFAEAETGTSHDTVNEASNLSPLSDEHLTIQDDDIHEMETVFETETIPSEMDEIEDEQLLAEDEQLKQAIYHLQNLLPEVTSHLAENGRLSDWVAFFKLVKSGEFNANHIASQLFFDVVKFSAIDDIHGMRYSKEVKEFWAVGHSLFRSKFLRFMGGYKTMLTDKEISENMQYTKTNACLVNFAIPDHTVLKEQKKTHALKCEKPGIMNSNIDVVAEIIDPKKSFTVCLDGKKITPGFGKELGEVDLFGNESPPTFSEKVNRLEVETLVIESIIAELGKLQEKDVEAVCDCTLEARENLKPYLFDILSILTERIKEMRYLKVSRQLTVEKLLKMAGEVWQKSKYAFAISSIKTQMHTINLLIDDILDVNRKIGLVISECQTCSKEYSLQRVISLQNQNNYVCLKDIEAAPQFKDEIPTELVKQRSSKWFAERKKAKVTGSTMNSAVGLDTLKRQKEHIDKVTNAVSSDVSSHETSNATCSSAMQHGIDNELNAVGTLCTLVLPVFLPSAKYHEEGFYKLSSENQDDFLIVSPDGSCRVDSEVKCAVEIKCPVPGKKYTPDVHYSLPKYYVCQCLSEMAALRCQKLLYLSWTPESTTILEIEFDEDLWMLLIDELHALYSGTTTIKPTKKRPAVANIHESIKRFLSSNVKLVAEFPSNVSIPCRHVVDITSVEDIKCVHGENGLTEENQTDREGGIKCMNTSTEAVQRLLTKAKQCVQEAYNVLRLPAKEVIVAILSDLDRTNIASGGVHGVPIAYGLSGYSLKGDCMRTLINDVVRACSEKNIKIKALSTDGQFYRLCVRNECGEPLTILQLAKDTWERARKMTKAEQISLLMNLNFEKHSNATDMRDAIDSNRERVENTNQNELNGPIIVKTWKGKQWPTLYNPRNLRKLMNTKEKERPSPDEKTTTVDFTSLPVDALNALANLDSIEIDEDIVDEVSKAADHSENGNVHTSDDVTVDAQLEEEDEDVLPDINSDKRVAGGQDEMSTIDVQTVSGDDLDLIIHDLCIIDKERKSPKWARLDRTKLKQLLSKEAKNLMATFTRQELLKCSLPFTDALERKGISIVDKTSKMDIANSLATLFGKESLAKPTKSPPKLRQVLKDYLSRKMGKQALNAILATRMFLEEDLPAWRKKAIFRDGVYVDSNPYVWYCQPEYFKAAGDYVVFLLDCHHLFVNARSYVCQYGIQGLGIKKDAWIDVATSSDSNDTCLNRAIVVDLIDRQSNAIAQIVFSEKVENEMRDLGWKNEAAFCRCIREWYNAEDEPGLPQCERVKMRMNMRNLLLSAVNVADFPPPGNTVSGMTMVMFEGILSNIDRRLQLHALVPENMYNVRAPNTLAVENFFSGFQDLDPKSTGVLLADDVPHALETASYLTKMRLNPNRSFSMRTTGRVPVYPSNPLCETSESTTISEGTQMSTDTGWIRSLDSIPISEHPFDSRSRRGKQPKRKKGTVPDYDKPSRGTMPVRQYHKTDSSKILPHVRRGLPDSI